MPVLNLKATTHPVESSRLGIPVKAKDMESVLNTPGPINLDVVESDWEAKLSGLVNLKHPEAVKAGLQERQEPIKIYAQIIRHPTEGFFLVDTGVSRLLTTDPAGVGVGWVLRQFVDTAKMKPRKTTSQLIRDEGVPLKGVFFTHLHVDHVSGMPDIPTRTPLFVGPGEASSTLLMNVFVQGMNDRLFAGRPPLQELQIPKDSDGVFVGILGVFGDRSLFAILSPGHTTGHLAFVARTPEGPVLLTGDACHTRWGWDNSVEPGSFLQERDPSRKSLLTLKAFSKRHPDMVVKLGHQE
ncbi:Metallo-beta-lactamase-like protein 1 [Elsinoe fawcettii]|nr:Metallo-beta-lactamase-like protein 1 [Elsinoe fawcettii]